jgi:YidC/Oxa1 family membrane protein insertase
MNPFAFLYTEILWRPLFNGLVLFYNLPPGQDLGLAIIALTAVIRLLLAPILWKSQRAQRRLAELAPELKKIQDKFKGDRERQGKATMEFYATHRVNPFSGCILLLIQLPILIALFQVFRQGFEASALQYLYPFIQNPGAFNPVSFGILDLTKGNIYLCMVAAATQYLQTKLAAPPAPPPPQSGGGAGDFAKALQWQTTYFFPLLILFWSYTLPSALTLYWTTLNFFGILQEITPKYLYGRYGDDQKRNQNHV